MVLVTKNAINIATILVYMLDSSLGHCEQNIGAVKETGYIQ